MDLSWKEGMNTSHITHHTSHVFSENSLSSRVPLYASVPFREPDNGKSRPQEPATSLAPPATTMAWLFGRLPEGDVWYITAALVLSPLLMSAAQAFISGCHLTDSCFMVQAMLWRFAL